MAYLNRRRERPSLGPTASNWWTTAQVLAGLVVERLFCYNCDSNRVSNGRVVPLGRGR